MSRKSQRYKEWMLEFNQDNTPSRELAFGAGYSSGYTDAAEDGFQEGQREKEIESLRTRLASAEEALRYNQSQFRFIFNATTNEEVASCAEYSDVKIERYFEKFKESEK
jgi:hypothetical protein